MSERPSAPPKPTNLGGLRIPSEVMEEEKLRKALEPLYRWCQQLGLYVDKLGVTGNEQMVSDIETDAQVQQQFVDLLATEKPSAVTLGEHDGAVGSSPRLAREDHAHDDTALEFLGDLGDLETSPLYGVPVYDPRLHRLLEEILYELQRLREIIEEELL